VHYYAWIVNRDCWIVIAGSWLLDRDRKLHQPELLSSDWNLSFLHGQSHFINKATYLSQSCNLLDFIRVGTW